MTVQRVLFLYQLHLTYRAIKVVYRSLGHCKGSWTLLGVAMSHAIDLVCGRMGGSATSVAYACRSEDFTIPIRHKKFPESFRTTYDHPPAIASILVILMAQQGLTKLPLEVQSSICDHVSCKLS